MSAHNNIGKLERVALREVWKHEAYDFTQWLENNIDVLNEALNIDLVNVDREQSTGTFSVDLVAEDTNGATIIIENQLEKSDHDHLGKVVTYLTAMDARAAIWIVSNPRPEHVAAIAWLNESSSADFYMVKIEAVKIGDSPAAALFTEIVGPSEEAKSVGITKKHIAERYQERKIWWTDLIERSTTINKLHTHITPTEYNWIGVSTGARGLNLNYYVTQKSCFAELYIDRGKDAEEENKTIFDRLYAKKEKIDAVFGHGLEWKNLEGKRACKIKYEYTGGGYRSPKEEWPEIQIHIIQAMDRLEKAFRPFIKDLNL